MKTMVLGHECRSSCCRVDGEKSHSPSPQPGLQDSTHTPHPGYKGDPPLTISPSAPPKSRKRRLAPSSEDICSFSKGCRSNTARAAPGSAAHSVKPLSMCTERLQGRPFHVQAAGRDVGPSETVSPISRPHQQLSCWSGIPPQVGSQLSAMTPGHSPYNCPYTQKFRKTGPQRTCILFLVHFQKHHN